MKNTICRECGGNCKPSKGIMNYHNMQTDDKSKEFTTVLEDCLKCEDCGHSFKLSYNIYLDRLKYFYKKFKFAEVEKFEKDLQRREYFSLREFCLDTQLISFNDIEVMEYEVNNEANSSF